MERTLVILEVSQKQSYIFSSNRLKDNAQRSAEIAYVTSVDFFNDIHAPHWNANDNLVYAGGGHIVLQFPSIAQAREFVAFVTLKAMKCFHGMELFAKVMPYDASKTAGKNRQQLSKELEIKKSQRKSSFHQVRFGLESTPVTKEQDDKEQDKKIQQQRESTRKAGLHLPSLEHLCPEGHEFPVEFSNLTENREDDPFIAVIHIDGNAMGKRVEALSKREKQSWEQYCSSMRSFSDGVKDAFESAFHELAQEIATRTQRRVLPLRPIIIAGDDVCFVTEGKWGLECARILMEKIAAKENPEQPNLPYASCAGVVMIHAKYPFHRAYHIAEGLCDNAKRISTLISCDRNEGRLSASVIDWHIEFGQLGDSVSDIRRDYTTDDGGQMELRPLTVVIPAELEKKAEGITYNLRTWDFFRGMVKGMEDTQKKVARGKLKELRTALKQGELESSYFLRMNQIECIKYAPIDARKLTNAELGAVFTHTDASGVNRYLLKPFVLLREQAKDGSTREVKRSLFFDAIEMMNHCELIEGANANE